MATISGSKVATEHCLPISQGAGVPDGLPPFWRLARELESDSSVRSTPKPVSRSTSAGRPLPSFDSARLHAKRMPAYPNFQFTLPTHCCRPLGQSACRKAVGLGLTCAARTTASLFIILASPQAANSLS